MQPTAPLFHANALLASHAQTLGFWSLPVASDGQALPHAHWFSVQDTALHALLLDTAQSFLSDEGALKPVALHPGLLLVPATSNVHKKRLGLVLAVSADPAQHASNLAWLVGQGLADTTAEEILAMAEPSHTVDHGPHLRAMALLAEQAVEAAVQQNAVAEFCERLDHAYDEIKLLYRLAHLFSESGDPQTAFESMCQEILAYSPFTWVSLVITEHASCGMVSSQPVIAGQCPCNDTTLQANALRLAGNDDWQGFTLLQPDVDPLAGVVHSEVFAYRILQGETTVGLLLAGNKIGPDPEASSFEQQLLLASSNFLGIYHDNASKYADKQRMLVGTLKALTGTIEAKDPYTCGHSERVAELAAMLAERIGWAPEEVERVRMSGLVHDVGKIGVPEAILCKPGRPTDDEFARIREHPVIGYNILKDIPGFDDLLDGVLYHHERWDGRGYPEGLTGEQIPPIARLLAVADTFDAMSSSRSYRQAMDREKVFAEFRRCAGSQFDPDLVEPFLTLDFSRFDDMLDDRRAKLWAA